MNAFWAVLMLETSGLKTPNTLNFNGFDGIHILRVGGFAFVYHLGYARMKAPGVVGLSHFDLFSSHLL